MEFLSFNFHRSRMAGGPILHLWNEWTTQILLLLSFALQIFLFVFAGSRRRGSSAVMRILLWLAYQMADATAVYTIGHLSINGLLHEHEHELVVFWVPFLLVHLGSQDTITAYALEDNQLWPRHLLNLGVQSFGVTHVLYMHFAEIPSLLGLATVLMVVVGVIKYGERIWALRCATLDSIQSSIKKTQNLPDYYDMLPSKRVDKQERDEEELLLFAQGMLPVCKGGITNFPLVLTSNPGWAYSNLNWNWNWKATFKVVEMELALMYDILYTKAAVIHTWYGYCIRVFSLLATVIAFILFQLSGNKNGYNRIDVAITYVLLVGAFLLDMASMFSALRSTWTCNFLLNRDWRWLGHVIMSHRWNVKASASNRGWSGSIGQFNLWRFDSRDKTKLSNKVAKMMGLASQWKKWHYSETLVISEDIKELVFKHVWELVKKIHLTRAEDENEYPPYGNGVEDSMAMMPPITECPGFRPELYDDTARRRKKLDDALNFSAELQEVILTWHVFTNVFVLFIDTPKDATSSTYLKVIKALSDYMVFLVALRPDMIPGLELRSLYESTVYDLKHSNIFSRAKVETLDRIMQKEDFGMSSIALRHGILYAGLMLELADKSNLDMPGIICSYEGHDRVAMDKLKSLMPDLETSCSRGDVFDMPKVLALILDTWVRLLVLTSVRSSREAHARQISRGSELTTVVWLMEEHGSVFFNQPTNLKGYYVFDDSDLYSDV